MNLFEKYRPRDLSQVVGQGEAVAKCQRIEINGSLVKLEWALTFLAIVIH